MDSKTAKAFDKALVKLEKEFDRVKLVMADLRASIQSHYPQKKKTPSEPAK